MGASAVLLVALLAVTAVEAARGRPRIRLDEDQGQRINQASQALSAWTPCSGVSPWELSSFEDGDIRFLPKNQSLKWKNNRLIYYIERTEFTPEHIMKIEGVIRELNRLSCMRLRHATLKEIYMEKDYVWVRSYPLGCYSTTVGHLDGYIQVVNLQKPNCLQVGTIKHLFFHAMGFYHTHNLPHRDDFIRILWENVNNETGRNFFRKYGPQARDFGVRYDYNSLMHATRRAHSFNGRDTIETYESTANIGRKEEPSAADIYHLNKLYDCPYDVDEDDED